MGITPQGLISVGHSAAGLQSEARAAGITPKWLISVGHSAAGLQSAKAQEGIDQPNKMKPCPLYPVELKSAISTLELQADHGYRQ